MKYKVTSIWGAEYFYAYDDEDAIDYVEFNYDEFDDGPLHLDRIVERCIYTWDCY